MIHSRSLRASGSEMAASIWVALSAPPLRRLSIVFLTSATSASEVSGVGACAKGTAGGWSGSLRASRRPDAAALAGAEVPNGAGRARRRGIAAAAVLWDIDLFFLDLSLDRSLDLAAAAIFSVGFAVLSMGLAVLSVGFAVLPAAFAVAAGELVVPP